MELLDLRVTGVPLPFLALCHVLAGGGLRELIRASRSLYQVAKAFSAETTLAMMTQRLVRDRCEVMRREAILQLGRSGDRRPSSSRCTRRTGRAGNRTRGRTGNRLTSPPPS